jgi:hypothetical protein
MKSLLKNKKITSMIVILFCTMIFFGFTENTNAYVGEKVAEGIKSGFEYIIVALFTFVADVCIYVLGAFITMIVWAIVHISQYNNFINEKVIVLGWGVIRDFCNMFFILVLLLIAFATILRYENYSVKKLLPKLIIMAVLINFSRMICGLIIDFSQVIMLTFIDTIGDTGGNYINSLGVGKYLNLAKTNNWNGDLNAVSTISGIVIGVIFMVIAVSVFLTLLGILVARIVMLWIYIVLSPLAFLLSAFPGGQSYASRWWDDFIKNVIIGPVLAFFIWLSLMAVDVSTSAIGSLTTINGVDSTSQCFGPGAILCPADFIGFVIAIGMLMGGSGMALSIGGTAGAAAGKVAGAVQKGRGMTWSGFKGGADWLNRGQAKMSGMDFNLARVGGKIKGSFDRAKNEDLSTMDSKANARLAKGGFKGLLGYSASGFGDQYLRGAMGVKGIKQALFGGRDNVKKWGDEEKKLKDKASRVFSVQELDKRNEMLQKAKDDNASLLLKRDRGEITSDDYNKGREKNDEIISDLSADKLKATKKEAEEERNALLKESREKGALASKYRIIDSEGLREQRAAKAEESKKIYTDNEDELVELFKDAVIKGEDTRAAVIAEKLAKIGGMNGLLAAHGYNAKSGLTEDEAKAAKAKNDGSYEKEKGFNDFMRDVFGGDLKVDKQQYLTYQNDIAGVAEGGRAHEYLNKPLSVNKQGMFEQTDSRTREKIKLGEKFKKEPEDIIRKSNRTEYGAENINGEFEWSDSGLAYFITQRDIISKEIDANRFNKSAAKAVIEKKAIQALRDKCKRAGITTYRPKGAPPTQPDQPIEKWFDELERYGKEASTESQENILNA